MMHPKDTEGLGADLAALFAPPTARDLADEPFRVHIYVRVSSPEQTRRKGKDGKPTESEGKAKKDEREDELSPATQEKRSRDWVAELPESVTKGRRVVVTVHVEAFTSRVLWGRPKFRVIMDEVAAGRVDLLVCLKPERLGANSEQQAILRFMLRQKGGDLTYVTQGYEDTAVGRVMATLYAEFNTMRLENLREQFRRRQLARVDAGRPLHSSHPPYGCAWADEEHEAYVFVPETTTHVVLLFQWYADGLSKRAIARTLNDRGIPPPGDGKGWYDTSVGVILENPIYVGRPQSYRYVTEVLPGLTASGKLRRRTRLRTEADEEQPREATKGLAPGQVPPVAEALWERVRARMAAVAADADLQSKGGREPGDPEEWLLRGGFLTCGTCEGPLQCGTDRGQERHEGLRLPGQRPRGEELPQANQHQQAPGRGQGLGQGHGVLPPTEGGRARARPLRGVPDRRRGRRGDRRRRGRTGTAGGGGGRGPGPPPRAEPGQRVAAGPDPRAPGRAGAERQAPAGRRGGTRGQRGGAGAGPARAPGVRRGHAPDRGRAGPPIGAVAPGHAPPGGHGQPRLRAPVPPSAVRGWQARERVVEPLFLYDPKGYATLAQILEWEGQEAGATGATAQSHLWHYACEA